MIGISIGSLNTVTGVFNMKSKAIDVILSETSDRTTPLIVNYDDRERTIGSRALTTIKSNIKRSFNYITRYLGLKPTNTARLIEESKYSINAPSIDLNGDVSFEITYKGTTDYYTPECLLGLFLSKLRRNWLRDGYSTNDVVVSVPDYFDITERQAMINALSIAKLNCVSLINESSAIALSYGLLRQRELPDDDTYKRIVAFVDMGHSKLNVFYCSFTKSNIKVLSVTHERSCGGREMDYLIAMHLASQFEAKYGCNPMKNQKCRLRLIEAITKARKQLTVNTDVTIAIDCLMEGEDLSYTLTREEFIAIVNPVIEKYTNVLKASIEQFTKETGIDIKDIHSIEMVGDCIRTPVLQSVIKELYNRDLSKTLLPDECITRGCVLFNAMNNPFITMKKFTFEHYNSNEIYMSYTNAEGEGKQIVLFPKGDNYSTKKSITFSNKQIKTNEDNGNGNKTLINVTIGTKKNKEDYQIEISGNAFIEENNPLTLYTELNQNGIWNLAQCKLFNPNPQCTILINPLTKNESITTALTAKLESNIQRELSHEANDDEFIRISNRKNDIEKCLYAIKEKYSNGFSAYIKPKEKEQLTKLLDSFIDWLYSGDEGVYNLLQLEQRYNEVIAYDTLIQSRCDNWTMIDKRYKAIEAMMQKTEAKAQEAVNKRRVNANDLRQINAALVYGRKRLSELKEGIVNSPKWDPPSMKNIEVIEKEVEEVKQVVENEIRKLDQRRNTFYGSPFGGGLFNDDLFF